MSMEFNPETDCPNTKTGRCRSTEDGEDVCISPCMSVELFSGSTDEIRFAVEALLGIIEGTIERQPE